MACLGAVLMLCWLPFATAQSSNHPSASNSNSLSATFTYSWVTLIFLVTCFFFFFVILCFYGCFRTRSNQNISIRWEENGISRRGNRGLDRNLIETFPTFAYSYVKGHKLGKGALECAVCLTEFQDKDTIRLLPKCDHVFHPVCIDAWLSKRTTCPVCRANLYPAPGEPSKTLDAVLDISEEPPVAAVAVAVSPEVINQTPMQNPSIYTGRFPRSHSTGHSVQPGENVERFTLRLPDHVRKQIMSMRQLKRTTSMLALPVPMSPLKNSRTPDESNTGGFVFSMVPPFFMRSSSPR